MDGEWPLLNIEDAKRLAERIMLREYEEWPGPVEYVEEDILDAEFLEE